MKTQSIQRWLLRVSTVALTVGLALGLPPVSVAHATTFTVNSANDVDDGACDATHCSLREAIMATNASAGTDTIAFNIPGAGPHTIQPTSPLPAIDDPLVIDGYTQPGASPNTNPVGSAINAVLEIELDGSNAGEEVVGLEISAGNSTVKGLVINRFTGYGIWLHTEGDNVIQGNFIGTNITGTVAMANYGDGVHIDWGSNNLIGGTAAGGRNLISGNYGDGVLIINDNATGNVVQGNYIGTDVTGTATLGNTGGVFISESDNIIGGTTAGARNIISGNAHIGVEIYGQGVTGNVVQGNYIGTDATGTADLGNGMDGVFIELASNNTVGGTTAGAGNLISGNHSAGVTIIYCNGTGNIIQNNSIGTDVTGTAALGNDSYGVTIQYTSNQTIGGSTAGAGNLISGNHSTGIYIHGSPIITTTGNVVQGNLIGTDVTGTAALGNLENGVLIDSASDNLIGGPTAGARNLISGNHGSGVLISNAATGNRVQGNSIFSNTGLGVDLGNEGVTPNDPGDGDTGANNLQNFPVLMAVVDGAVVDGAVVDGAVVDGAVVDGGTIIIGALDSTAHMTFTLEFFTNAACDPSGYGEGQTLLGSTEVTTDSRGKVDFSVTFPAAVPAGQSITATVTDLNRNTSEFSLCIQPTYMDKFYIPLLTRY